MNILYKAVIYSLLLTVLAAFATLFSLEAQLNYYAIKYFFNNALFYSIITFSTALLIFWFIFILLENTEKEEIIRKRKLKEKINNLPKTEKNLLIKKMEDELIERELNTLTSEDKKSIIKSIKENKK